MADEIAWLTATELAAQYRAGTRSPVEVTRALLERAARLNPRLNAFLALTADLALEQAGAAERALRRGEAAGPLTGVPYALKDLVATAGLRTTAGSRLRAEWVPDEDAPVVERLRAAGAVLVGKANLHEFAYGATTINPHYGAARNPWDTEHIAGGSSGGSAVAVAAGLAPLAIGTDTGGSVRIPAALCGLVGLKTTYGRVPNRGVLALSWTQDTVGPMTRTAEDAALLLQALAGHDLRDPTSARVPVPDYRAALAGGVRGLRIGAWREQMDYALPEVRAAVEQALGTLRDLGASVEEVSWPYMRTLTAAGIAAGLAEATALHREDLRATPALYGADVRQRLEQGVPLPAYAYVRAQQTRRYLMGEYLRLLERFDLLAGPASPVPAPGLEAEEVMLNGQRMDPRAALAGQTRPYNALGAPAISVPCGFSAGGLPLALQLAGRPWDEPLLLRAAHAYQQATDWHTRRPPLAASA